RPLEPHRIRHPLRLPLPIHHELLPIRRRCPPLVQLRPIGVLSLQRAVIPAKAGIHCDHVSGLRRCGDKWVVAVDSGFRRNDDM
ncbi:hypothetical protein, partial [Dyella terrae]|uniref:hypothetical protein n=1 Tax=Dyella terrae TaxID=522259 RepID=UPI00197A94D5